MAYEYNLRSVEETRVGIRSDKPFNRCPARRFVPLLLFNLERDDFVAIENDDVGSPNFLDIFR